jgi:DNA-binding transcriptional regulator YbjK
MNLKDYYREIDAVLATIESSFVRVVSLQTPNGGRAGVVSEVNRATAAKMIVEQSARLMTPEELAELTARQIEEQKRKELAELQDRMRVTLLADAERFALRKAMQQTRKGK